MRRSSVGFQSNRLLALFGSLARPIIMNVSRTGIDGAPSDRLEGRGIAEIVEEIGSAL